MDDVTQDQYRITDDIKTGKAEQLWSFTVQMTNPFRSGFTFSYPASQQFVDQGVLQTWTKGLDISGVEGEDVAAQLKEAIGKRDLPIRLVAFINDTTGAMIA
ncbi:hypothetical protein CERZMDRAFT_92684 [Cercospora zeae-maydis SCOH1-5]|uniref:Phosphotransferase n=1 Tax=Cercospora zeae-maydis SCOH1-5 TaxID=717836 RepID=A0A6A6FX48_9PEZI|nr:hypothetical protein CERZMDRAFT_92684 [Cercospora zeae-maydis SCOH1-5]